MNEYNVGEALERIGKTDPERLYSLVAMSAMALYKVFPKHLHADTTTLSFYGAHDSDTEPAEGCLRLVPGNNKDHMPGCNQAVVGQIVTEHGIPIFSSVMDGNTSDVEWNGDSIEHLVMSNMT
ncbi:MAG: hypothetical protein QM296_08850 [Bacillota bacterium]|nr:hypothetical protein [Bacillota bacterium]